MSRLKYSMYKCENGNVEEISLSEDEFKIMFEILKKMDCLEVHVSETNNNLMMLHGFGRDKFDEQFLFCQIV